jgi:hypothetical protein
VSASIAIAIRTSFFALFLARIGVGIGEAGVSIIPFFSKTEVSDADLTAFAAYRSFVKQGVAGLLLS